MRYNSLPEKPATHMNTLDKKLIEQRFSSAAQTYEQQATIQLLVADNLLAMLDASTALKPQSVFEIGCCTGLMTQKIISRFTSLNRLTVSDLVPTFAPYIHEKTSHLSYPVTFLAGDIETLELQGSYDMVISSSTLHWINNLPALLEQLTSHINPGGILALSLYGPKNLKEIKQVAGIGLEYRSMEQILAITAQHYTILASGENEEPLWFASTIAMLQHLRDTGVNAVGHSTWTRRRLNHFIQEYQRIFSGPGGVRLTYHPIYVIARPRLLPESQVA